MTPTELIDRLGLEVHPEGGHFRETYRHRNDDGSRGCMTAIYYLLQAGERSHWHRVDADEIWHFYAGEPLELSMVSPDEHRNTVVLGPDLSAGQSPQLLVPAGHWQAARPLGAWTLCGCTVAPAFDFAGFEMLSGTEP